MYDVVWCGERQRERVVCDVLCVCERCERDVGGCGGCDGVVKWEVPQVGGSKAREEGGRRGRWVMCEWEWGGRRRSR